ncbi:hypothetical protein LEMA_P076900.1 [Plenodomus lingam JN3]|uniref:Impact N-terminal domain-containing protein n=1 Tax=Leptosphaeria maculans (strain JN3 / isolate v23.1.3 / race Av1-4-5-6-7-8) TaxID=985895 RepID=E5A906_LEPMJ|nr:hypothetical protein LEMA_P076900.1 [Plenodomus lingam JN3]CBY00101.1 hypothetical protein LEMA_P076900.1 [Plenodomus lingam JN3]
MSSAAQSVQTLLRFLSQDAKLPLAQAIAKAKDLQAASLITPSDLSKADLPTLKSIFADDEKVARQVLNAAKRVCKKRSASEATASDAGTPLLAVAAAAPSSKKIKPLFSDPMNASELEASLALPAPELDEEKLKATTLYTNRAPLVLAFAVVLTKFTMPQQPLSSRLSLAQAVTSMNSKSKAVSIGLQGGRAAEDEGWGEGQPVVRIMTRDVRVMKRWGYEWESADTAVESTQAAVKQDNTLQDTPTVSPNTAPSSQDTLAQQPPAKEPALWAIDLEARRRASQTASPQPPGSQLPIYSAQSARAYLLKAFESAPAPSTAHVKGKGGTPAKRTAAVVAAEKKRNLGFLLGALELLFRSWAVLDREELDRKAWGCYVRVRPEVAAGAAGWGGKGNVKLSDILALRRA